MSTTLPVRRPKARCPPYTIRKTVKSLRGFGTWLTREGLANPFALLDIPTVPKTLVEALSPAEVNTLLGALNPNTANGARNQALILLMLDSGPRVSEVSGLHLPEPNLPEREAKLMGKGRTERCIPFGQKTARALLRYITAFRPEPANNARATSSTRRGRRMGAIIPEMGGGAPAASWDCSAAAERSPPWARSRPRARRIS